MHIGGKLLLALFVLSGALFAQDNALIGIWKVDLAKSQYNSGPPPRSATIRYEPYGKNGMRITMDIVDARGIATHTVYTTKRTRNGYAAKVDPSRETVALRPVDASTTEVANKDRGTVATVGTVVLSQDGRSRTILVNGANAQHQPVSDIIVFDKQ
jgi:hypothetical protein